MHHQSDVQAAVRPRRHFDSLLRVAKKIAKITLIAQACIVLLFDAYFVFLAVFSLFADIDDAPENTPEQLIADLGVDIGQGTVTTSLDTHGGFLGDGLTFISVVFPDDYAESALSGDALLNNEKWSPLPFTRELSVLVYGDEERNEGAHIVAGNEGTALIPGIENGYYCFIDRYKISDERPEDKNILERYSQNFTLVIYDCDTRTLYYAKLDT